MLYEKYLRDCLKRCLKDAQEKDFHETKSLIFNPECEIYIKFPIKCTKKGKN